MLTHNGETILPIEQGQYSDWMEHYEKEVIEERKKEELSMLIEIRELAQLLKKCYKDKIAKIISRKVKRNEFAKVTLVLW